MPGQPTVERTETVPGAAMPILLRAQLLTSMHEIEQDEATGRITTRWTRQSKRNNYRTLRADFRKLPAGATGPAAPVSGITNRAPEVAPRSAATRRAAARHATQATAPKTCGGCFQERALSGACGC
ncbi:hypothetical protein AB0N14_17715 [Streptomyces sp. NPDC051104]|uniref:hypothetical protein n=1 Tax=Streptomyces sp. NPDC051104 TaxID=3155044 RepID=UPI0034140FE8